MIFERRDFLRSAATGVALGFASRGAALRQASAGGASGELQGGSGFLQLEGRLKSGLLKLEAQDFVDRTDRSVIIRGKLDSTDLYSAMFCYKYDRTVFALFHDTGHSTTLIFFDSDQPKIGRLVLWNDTEAPQTMSIDKSKIMEAKSPKDIVDMSGKVPDFLGKRKPPEFTWRELEAVFGANPALLEFMRGKKSLHDPPPGNTFPDAACRLLSLVPGSTLSLAWLGGG
ncbi:MAG: hypothetical protein DMG40_02315 [Acidobacteria bacterium]|nr:MAG: hypothetical protein DMG40_02315 [Acidobacteriota bacterium]